MGNHIAAGALIQRAHQLIVGLGTGVKVTAEGRIYGTDQVFPSVVHGEQGTVFFHIVNGADHIVEETAVDLGEDILLNAETHRNAVGVGFLQAGDFPAVGQGISFGHAAGIFPEMRMPGETDLRAPQPDCLENQFLRGVRAVAVCGMRMVIGKHHAIFSCLTLWSITWREASSARISSGRMPISTIITMT